jgi:hypothetical protein
LKYYDISFNMDYFGFVEKCKEFILWMLNVFSFDKTFLVNTLIDLYTM